MRSLVVAKGLIGAFLLIGASMFMNWHFWAGQGNDNYLARVLGSVSIGVDLFKAALPVIIAWAWSESRRIGAALASFFFITCFTFSLFSALGFANSTRGTADATREGASLTLESAKRELKAAEERLGLQPSTRPKAVIDEAIEKAKQDRRWTTSDRCQDATVESSRAFCRSIGDLRVELASAADAAQREAQIHALSAKVAHLVSAGASLDVDPQAGMIARITPFSVDTAKTLLVALFAIVVEIGASFGLYFAVLPLKMDHQAWTSSPFQSANAMIALPPPTRFVRSNGKLMIE